MVYTLYTRQSAYTPVSFAKRACMCSLQRGEPKRLFVVKPPVVHAPLAGLLFLLTVQPEGLLNACVSYLLKQCITKKKTTTTKNTISM